MIQYLKVLIQSHNVKYCNISIYLTLLSIGLLHIGVALSNSTLYQWIVYSIVVLSYVVFKEAPQSTIYSKQ